MKASEDVVDRANALVQQYEMETVMRHEEFAGLHGLEPSEQEALTKMEMKKLAREEIIKLWIKVII